LFQEPANTLRAAANRPVLHDIGAFCPNLPLLLVKTGNGRLDSYDQTQNSFVAAYPIHVEPLHPYAGADPQLVRRFQEDVRMARTIESFINRKIEHDFARRKSATIKIDRIARAMNTSPATIRKYLQQFIADNAGEVMIEIESPIED